MSKHRFVPLPVNLARRFLSSGSISRLERGLAEVVAEFYRQSSSSISKKGLIGGVHRDVSKWCSCYAVFSSLSGVTQLQRCSSHCCRYARFYRNKAKLERAVESVGDRLISARKWTVGAIMASTPATKRSSLSASWDHDSSVKRKVRKFADNSIETIVERAIRDHCKAWSNQQLNCMAVHAGGWCWTEFGRSCHGCLWELPLGESRYACGVDLDSCAEAKEKHKSGEARDTVKLFWAWLTASFCGPAEDSEEGLVLNDTEEPAKPLFTVYAELLKSDPDSSRVPQTWHHYSRTDTDLVAFLTVHEDVVYTCLCRAHVQKVVAVGENECLSTVDCKLRLLWLSGRFAKLLLAAPMRQIVSTVLHRARQDRGARHAYACRAQGCDRSRCHRSVRADGQCHQEQYLAMTVLDGRRDVEMVYNGIKFSMQSPTESRTASHTAEMKIELAIRESARLGKEKRIDVQATLMVKGGVPVITSQRSSVIQRDPTA
eukprot:5930108-Amphidinium_carterae.6